MAHSLKEVSIALISSTGVALNATGQTTLYTVPAGKVFVPIMAALLAGGNAGVSVVTLGQSGALTDFLDSQTLGNIDASGDVAILQPVPNATPVKIEAYAAGTVFQIDVTTGSGNASNTVKLFGFLYDA